MAQTKLHCLKRNQVILEEPETQLQGSARVSPHPDCRYSLWRFQTLLRSLLCYQLGLPAASDECVIARGWKDGLLHRFADSGSLQLRSFGCVLRRCSSGAKPGIAVSITRKTDVKNHLGRSAWAFRISTRHAPPMASTDGLSICNQR